MGKVKKNLKVSVALTSIVLLLIALFFSPVYAMSEKEREELSKEMLGEIVKVHGEPEEIDDDQKAAQVFYSLVEHTERKDVKYRIKTVKSDVVNAYAMPNGQVVITTGLLNALPDGDLSPLAFICAHEISHIEKRHAERKMGNRTVWLIGIALLVRKSDRWVQTLGAVAHSIVASGYSRAMEEEADREGVNLMQKAHYDPYGAIVVFETLEEAKKGRPDARIFPTHPLLSDRKKNIVAWMGESDIQVAQNEEEQEGIKETDVVVAKYDDIDHDKDVEPKISLQSEHPIETLPPSAMSISDMRIDYSQVSSQDLKRGFYVKNWEDRLSHDISKLYATKEVSINCETSRQKAKSITFGTFQSREEEDRILLVFLEESYTSYPLFFQKFQSQVLPAIKPRLHEFSNIGIAVKRNKRKQYHIVILLEK